MVSIELPRAAWLSIWKWTAGVTAALIVLSIATTELVLLGYGKTMDAVCLVCATILPLALGGPSFFCMLARQRKLALTNERLRILASTDGLTGCLNRRAFTTEVMARLADGEAGGCGALLVIDADEFKSINDRFGHDQGDAALKCIAAAIRSSVRRDDPVGRMGGEEFATFLVGADHHVACAIADRILAAIREARFAPNGQRHPLSVSIGGAALGRQDSFATLYRTADRCLYEAKQAGRDRLEMPERRAAA